MRWMSILFAVQLLFGGCRGLPQPMVLSPPVKSSAPSSRLPDALSDAGRAAGFS